MMKKTNLVLVSALFALFVSGCMAGDGGIGQKPSHLESCFGTSTGIHCVATPQGPAINGRDFDGDGVKEAIFLCADMESDSDSASDEADEDGDAEVSDSDSESDAEACGADSESDGDSDGDDEDGDEDGDDGDGDDDDSDGDDDGVPDAIDCDCLDPGGDAGGDEPSVP